MFSLLIGGEPKAFSKFLRFGSHLWPKAKTELTVRTIGHKCALQYVMIGAKKEVTRRKREGWTDFKVCFCTIDRYCAVDTVNTKAKQYQECETLITRIEVRIMRCIKKGEG